ncbi:MAG: hypothetical protein M3O41_11490 [Pseudomonadota bacterium]|nr:hypothetical protein [Pseudomonadota bacterium]
MKSGGTGNLVSIVTLFLMLPGCAALSSKDAGEARAPGSTDVTSSPASRPNESTTPPANPATDAAAQAPANTRAAASTPAAGTSSGQAPGHRRIPAPPVRSAAQGVTAANAHAAQPASSAGTKPTAADKPSAPSAPALDLSSLEQRLKDTRAIGVFTKLSLKNQVDDLLAQFRAYHQSSTKTPPPADLRHQYDSLIVKVLALLQNGDPQLASAVSSSREAIWGILVDPEKFAKI